MEQSPRRLEELDIQGRDHPKFNIFEIRLNTKKNFGNLRQTSVKDHKIMLMWKILNNNNNNNNNKW